jgi:hypothetical protein
MGQRCPVSPLPRFVLVHYNLIQQGSQQFASDLRVFTRTGRQKFQRVSCSSNYFFCSQYIGVILKV